MSISADMRELLEGLDLGNTFKEIKKAHKGPYRTDLVAATVKKLHKKDALEVAKDLWVYFRDKEKNSTQARFWMGVAQELSGGEPVKIPPVPWK